MDPSSAIGLTAAEPLAGNYFVATYPPFSCWTKTATRRFRDALERPAPSPVSRLGLYAHLPFCLKRCAYCYYLSYDDRSKEIGGYVDAVVREAELYAQTPAVSGRAASFVYFGGGTPSLLQERWIRRLIGGLRRAIPWRDDAEVTFECSPRSVTEGKLRALRDCGANRISLGAQHFDDRVLLASGRVHLVSDIQQAYTRIRRAGFDHVNIDLIVGLPGETPQSLERSLAQVTALAPESVTVYLLEIPHNTPLFQAVEQGTLSDAPATWEIKRSRLKAGYARLEQAGYSLRSAYNAVRDPTGHRFRYQEEQYRGADVIGIGASSFSYLSGVHQQNVAALEAYLKAIGRDELPLWRAHALSDEERMVREFVLQMKLGQVRFDDFVRKFSVDPARRFVDVLADLEERGWLQVDPDGVRLTHEGLARVDGILPLFYLDEHRGLRYS